MKKLFLVISILFFFCVGLANATTYYVRTDGNDSTCDGTQDEAAGDGTCAWLTIPYGQSQLSCGDTLIVGDGTYATYETFDSPYYIMVDLDDSQACTLGNEITIKSQNKWGAILDGTAIGREVAWGFRVTNGTKYINIEDFEIKNVSQGVRLSTTVEDGTNNITLYRLKIHDIDAFGILTGAYTELLTVDSCLIYNIYGEETYIGVNDYHYWVHNHCMYLVGKDILIKNNILYAPEGGMALRLDGYSGDAPAVYSHLIVNNTLHWGWDSCINPEGCPEAPYDVPQQRGLINIYSDSARTYATSDSPTSLCIIDNNILIDPPKDRAIQIGTYGSNDCEHGGGDAQYTYIRNNVTDVADMVYSGCTGEFGAYTNNSVNVNLYLTDIDTNDYYPTASSTDIIDKGLATNAPALDFNGTSRPIGGADDIGAYERQAGPIISLTSPIGLQACGYSGVITVESTLNSNCNYEDSATGSCSDDYTSLGVGGDPFTGGEAGTTHTVTVANTCDTSTTYIVICEDSSTAEDSNCIEVNMNIAAETGSPQPTPVSIVGGGSAGIVGGGNVTMY